MTIAVLAYNEAKIDTRKRNLFGYSLYFMATAVVLVVSAYSFPEMYVPESLTLKN